MSDAILTLRQAETIAAAFQLTGDRRPDLFLAVEKASLQSELERHNIVLRGGRRGDHSLLISATSANRLVAHLRGYAQRNGYTEEQVNEALRKAGLLETAPAGYEVGQFVVIEYLSNFNGRKKGERLARVVGPKRSDGWITVSEWIASSRHSRRSYTTIGLEHVIRAATLADHVRFHHKPAGFARFDGSPRKGV